METFSALLALCEGTPPVTGGSPHGGQWRGPLMLFLMCAWKYGSANNLDAGDLRCHGAHYDVTVRNYSFQTGPGSLDILVKCRRLTLFANDTCPFSQIRCLMRLHTFCTPLCFSLPFWYSRYICLHSSCQGTSERICVIIEWKRETWYPLTARKYSFLRVGDMVTIAKIYRYRAIGDFSQ